MFKDLQFSNKAYDILKSIEMIFLPALATLYAAVAMIWELPYVEEITATIGAIEVFLGACLKVSSDNYWDDEAEIEDEEEEILE